MNATGHPAAHGAHADRAQAREQRRLRAAIAARLQFKAPAAAATLDWDALDRAPAWLALPERALATLQRQVGALLYAPDMRLWIDGRRLAAARVALGEAFLNALLAQRDAALMPLDAAARARIETAEQVAARLAAAGAAVLLAAIPAGALREVAAAAMAPLSAAAMACELAQSLVARALVLSAQAATHGSAPAAAEAAASRPSAAPAGTAAGGGA
jgi:hypothetical protein